MVLVIDTMAPKAHGHDNVAPFSAVPSRSTPFDAMLLTSVFRHLRPRSNGIRVRQSVARSIRRGDRARARGDWSRAASAYAGALEAAPWLAHIWVQLGHAHKESGDIEIALADYARAADLSPTDPDPRIHLGLCSKLLGRSADANRHYLAALERGPADLSTTIDALRTAPAKGPERDRVMARIAAILGEAWPADADERVPADPSGILCADITDLLAYFGRARLPTGIQRVQIEILMAIGSVDPDLVTICCYSAQREGWSAVNVERFMAIARLALASDDREDAAWRHEVAAMHLALARAPLLSFTAATVLLNLGTSWSERNYFLHVRMAREESGVAYVPIVYDCIPMFAPQWFPAALARDYRGWMDGLFDAADGAIAISQATRSDLLRIAPGAQGAAAADAIRVVPVDGDFRRAGAAQASVERLARWGLASETYVLMVSTIEPRKNHVGAFGAWLKLVARYGSAKIPTLVCVGGQGWLNDAVHMMIRRHRVLRKKVVLLSGIADADLDLLYRHAMFTLYPSLYEGWGLPVTESLCHGRVPAISSNSSLPEAGGSFAVYFDPTDPASIADAIAPLVLDTASRRPAEQRITRDFHPRSWREIALAMAAEAAALGERRPLATGSPQVDPEIFYMLGTDVPELPSVRSGERFRFGWNWAQPGTQGNPVGAAAAGLRMTVPAGDWVAHLRMSAEQEAVCHVATSLVETQHVVEPTRAVWIAVPLRPDANGVAEISLSASHPLLLAGFAMTGPNTSPPLISDSTQA